MQTRMINAFIIFLKINFNSFGFVEYKNKLNKKIICGMGISRHFEKNNFNNSIFYVIHISLELN